MSLPEVPLENLIDFTSSGVNCANFVQIKEALIKKYKEIYGSDIDLSTGTADGVWVHYIGLIINNILQSVQQLYKNLDVNFATGEALDSLCSLSNIVRREATYSTASLKLTNLNSSNNYLENNTPFFDKYGSIWIYDGERLEFAGNEEKYITVRAENRGPIFIEANCILNTVEAGLNFSISQPNKCIVGEDKESDTDLRARRNSSNANPAVTVLTSLNGSLREISGMRDVKIYNLLSTAEVIKDSTEEVAHSAYICLRYDNIDDESIGRLIYNKMTPGIPTLESGDEDCQKSYIITVSPFDADEKEIIYWKKCKAVNPTITISFTKLSNFTNDEIDEIANSMFEYLNNLNIGEDLTSQNLIVEIINSDPLAAGRVTYYNVSATLPNSATSYTNEDNYYNYTTHSSNTGTGNTVTFTLS